MEQFNSSGSRTQKAERPRLSLNPAPVWVNNITANEPLSCYLLIKSWVYYTAMRWCNSKQQYTDTIGAAIMKMVPMELWTASFKGKNGYWLLYPPAQRYCGGESERERQKWRDRQTNSVSIEIKDSVFRHWTYCLLLVLSFWLLLICQEWHTGHFMYFGHFDTFVRAF